jgi:predicted phosphoribosyltransferase
MPVAFEVAKALRAPLDVFVVCKLGVPGYEDLVMGAVASGGARAVNEEVMLELGVPLHLFEEVAARQMIEVLRREQVYRGGRSPTSLQGRTVILVDDGLATGSSMRAAMAAARARGPARLVVAIPIAAAEACASLRAEADDVICAVIPDPFYAIGYWYEDFSQVTDEVVRNVLERADRELPAALGAEVRAPR